MLPAVLAWAFLALLQLAAASESSGKVASGAAAGAAAGAGAVPEWRVDAALHPARTLRTLLTDKTEDNEAVARLGTPMGSTVGQDRQRCSLVKLPSNVLLKPLQASWSGQSGIWESSGNNIRLGNWGQNYFSQGWETIYIRNQDDKLSLKAEARTLNDLKQMYGWRPGAPVSTYVNISTLEHRAQIGAYHGFQVVASSPSDVEVVAIKPPHLEDLTKIMAFSDCEGQLLFVARFEDRSVRDRPSAINIFDRAGTLLAHTLIDDPTVMRYQFVDPNGYLIATAEAPGLHHNVPIKSVPVDPSKGSIMPFEIQFEMGGYPNASRLLDVDYHWVIVAAVQARAVADAHFNWTPSLSTAVTAIYWCFAAVGLVACICTGGMIYRLVYPDVPIRLEQPMWKPLKGRNFNSESNYASVL